jgi:hypothetical protein
MIEHRWSERVAVHCEASLISKDYCAFGVIRNVSHYGLYIATPLPFPRNKVIEVRFHLPDNHRNDLQILRALTVYSHANGMGLMVDVRDQTVKTNIASLVAQCSEPSVFRRSNEPADSIGKR